MTRLRLPFAKRRGTPGGPRPSATLASRFHPDRLLPRKPGQEALRDPRPVPARALDLSPEELAIGVEVRGVARLYPVAVLHEHHLVNDILEGVPILIAFCRRCFSGVAFDPVVEGRRLCFEPLGGYEGGLVVRDDLGGLWSAITGEAISGRPEGARLTMFAAEMTSVGAWLARHPDSSTPEATAPAASHRLRPGMHVGRAWMRTVTRRDRRLPPRTLILGVQAGRSVCAYELDATRPGPRLFQDQLGDVPIALLAPPGSWPLAYDRRCGDRVIDLIRDGDRLVDPTGSSWTWTGRAVEGPLAGAQLPFIESHITEWYAWAAHHGNSDVRRRRHIVEPA